MSARRRPSTEAVRPKAAQSALARMRGRWKRAGELLIRAARMPQAGSLAGFLRKAAFPPAPVAALAVPVIAVLMAWVFLLGNEDSPLAYAAYVASAYLLAVLCIRVGQSLRHSGLHALAARSTLADRALHDAAYRRRMLISIGLAVDTLWAAANIVAGARLMSIWLITLGAYYLLLSTMRGALLLCMHRLGGRQQRSAGIGRLCGTLLLLSTFVLSGIVCLVMRGEGAFVYEGMLIYAVAAFAFYSLAASAALHPARHYAEGAKKASSLGTRILKMLLRKIAEAS